MSNLQITALAAGAFTTGAVLALVFRSSVLAKLTTWRDAALAKLGLKVKE